jgi:hypothetical protein
MARKNTARKQRSITREPDIATPTPEQMSSFKIEDIHDKASNGATIKLGKAYRRRPMIDTLQDLFSDAEYKALKHYRHHADVADRSPLKDSLNKAPGGGTGCPSVEILNACRVRDDCERAAGSLRDILRAVVVYDLSLSQWAMQRSGARQEGNRMKPHKKALAIAQLDISMVAQRVKNELDGGNLDWRPCVIGG